ncbi:MAG TPA: hypothetical protein VF708_06975 [Pyrinomonadaceae bacterium]|jgi:hypothetical protein
MQKVTSLILQIAMVMGAIYYRVTEVRADLSAAQQEANANVTRALDLLKQARLAMGGEDALKALQSLSISATARRTFQDQNGQPQERSGKVQLYLSISGKLEAGKASMKLPPAPRGDGATQADRVFIIKKAPGHESAGAVDKAAGAGGEGQPRKRVVRLDGHQAPMAAHPMGVAPVHFLLTSILGAPAPFPVEYSYAGEAQAASGSVVDLVEAKYPGGLVVRLSLDKQTHLPLSMTYRTLMPPPLGAGARVVFRHRIGTEGEAEADVMPAPEAGDEEIPDILIEEDTRVNGGSPSREKFQIPLPPPQEVEAQVSFSDFNATGGILLPHRITQSFDGGKVFETWEVETYEINSPSRLENLK